MSDIKSIADRLVGLTVKEINELLNVLKEDHGIEPATAAVAVAAAEGGAKADTVEEKSTFDVILKEVGASKLNVVKAVKDVTSLGLKEAKDIVDAAPKPVKEGISKQDAEDAAAKLKAAGAEVEIK